MHSRHIWPQKQDSTSTNSLHNIHLPQTGLKFALMQSVSKTWNRGLLSFLKTVLGDVQWPFKEQNCRLVLLSLILTDTTGLWLWTPIFPPKFQGGKNLFPVFSLALSLVFFSTSISFLELSLSHQLAKCFFREKALENVKSCQGSFFKLSYLRRVGGGKSGLTVSSFV